MMHSSSCSIIEQKRGPQWQSSNYVGINTNTMDSLEIQHHLPTGELGFKM